MNVVLICNQPETTVSLNSIIVARSTRGMGTQDMQGQVLVVSRGSKGSLLPLVVSFISMILYDVSVSRHYSKEC
jgi:hypothetical protein